MKLWLEMTTFTQVYSMYLINIRCSFVFLGFYSWKDFHGTRTNILNSHSNFISYWSSLVTQSVEWTPCSLRNVVCWTNGNQIPWNVFGEMWSPYVQRTDTQTHTHTHIHTRRNDLWNQCLFLLLYVNSTQIMRKSISSRIWMPRSPKYFRYFHDRWVNCYFYFRQFTTTRNLPKDKNKNLWFW
jgi:hypothetical protein